MNKYISYNEYKKQIIDEWTKYKRHNVFNKNNGQLIVKKNIINKTYIDLDICFFCLPSYQQDAWISCLESVRQHYPNNPIILMEDGNNKNEYDYRDIATKYNCIYIEKDLDIYLYFATYLSTYEFLLRMLEAVNISNTEWLILLHPDNLCLDKISRMPPGPCCGLSCGSYTEKSNNKFRNIVNDYLVKKTNNLEINGFGWAGGSIINCNTFKDIMKTFTLNDLKNINNMFPDVTQHEDIFIPFLFNYYGYEYRVWIEIEEANRNFNGQYGAFTHGVKHKHKNEKSLLVLSGQGSWMFDILMKKIPIAIKNDEAILINSWLSHGPSIIDKIKDTGVKIVQI